MRHGLRATIACAATALSVANGAAADSRQWSGWYVGLAVGAKWTDAAWTTTQIGAPPSVFAGTPPDASLHDGFRPLGLRIGGYAGHGWQADRWVYGVEVDAAWSDATDTHIGIPGCKIMCFAGAPGPGKDSSSVRALWDASLRARLGYLAWPDLLLYGTAGVAVQAIDVAATCENTLADPVCLVAAPFARKTQTDAHTLAGWTVGAGVERRFGRWRLRGEYRYADFGTATGVLFAGQPAIDPGADAIFYRVRLRTHLSVFGMSYAF